jgi:hypothetical protein
VDNGEKEMIGWNQLPYKTFCSGGVKNPFDGLVIIRQSGSLFV